MATPQEIVATARTGADSVYRYVERTAEPAPAGEPGIRWQTLNSQNEPQYEACVFNGVAGIPLFLADYARLTGTTRALELARGGAEWCSAPDRLYRGDDPRGWPAPESLCFGRAGAALAWLRLAQVTHDPNLAQHAAAGAERLLKAEPGPVTDFLGGAAGEGIFLVRLWETTHDAQHLTDAVRRAEWLAARAVRDAGGCYWPVQLGVTQPRTFLGFAHGITGIGYFLLALFEATRDAHWADLAREVAATVAQQAVPDRGGLNWPALLGLSGLGDRPRCQWCHGSPGVGLFYAKAYEVLGEPSYLATAEAAGETTFAYGDVRHNPSQCHGLAGNAELFVELYRLTHDFRWLDRAHDFAQLALAYRSDGPQGDTWQADEPGYASPDFLCGAAGTGHFFLRLLAPDDVRMPLQ